MYGQSRIGPSFPQEMNMHPLVLDISSLPALALVLPGHQSPAHPLLLPGCPSLGAAAALSVSSAVFRGGVPEFQSLPSPPDDGTSPRVGSHVTYTSPRALRSRHEWKPAEQVTMEQNCPRLQRALVSSQLHFRGESPLSQPRREACHHHRGRPRRGMVFLLFYRLGLPEAGH